MKRDRLLQGSDARGRPGLPAGPLVPCLVQAGSLVWPHVLRRSIVEIMDSKDILKDIIPLAEGYAWGDSVDTVVINIGLCSGPLK